MWRTCLERPGISSGRVSRWRMESHDGAEDFIRGVYFVFHLKKEGEEREERGRAIKTPPSIYSVGINLSTHEFAY